MIRLWYSLILDMNEWIGNKWGHMHLSYSLFAINNILPFIHTYVLGGERKREGVWERRKLCRRRINILTRTRRIMTLKIVTIIVRKRSEVHACSVITVVSDSLQLTQWTAAQQAVHGVLQARILEWVARLSSRGSLRPTDRTGISCFAGGFFTTEPLGKPKKSAKRSVIVGNRNPIFHGLVFLY